MIVEDGSGRADADSYVSLEEADRYHLTRRNLSWIEGSVDKSLKEAALVRATQFVDATYRGQFTGYRKRGRAQTLEWPRVAAYTYSDSLSSYESAGISGYPQGFEYQHGYDYISVDEIPREIVSAVCEGALRELVSPGSLAPDLERGGAVKRAEAGTVAVEFFDGAPAQTTFQAIDLALRSLLLSVNEYSGRVARG